VHAWTVPELARFLRWADEHDCDIAMAWRLLAYAGMRRGEEELLPVIRLHDLRHTHATLLLAAGEPVEVVSERLGHASATITLTSTSTCTRGWGGRRPPGSPRCSTAEPMREVSRGPQRPLQQDTPGS